MREYREVLKTRAKERPQAADSGTGGGFGAGGGFGGGSMRSFGRKKRFK